MNSALMTRLAPMPYTSSVRNSGRAQMKANPSATACRAFFGAPSVRATGERSVRIRPSSTHETAKVTASKRNGAQRVKAYRMPPSGPPSRSATCWRAWYWLSAVGSCSVGTTARTTDISAGVNSPAQTPVSSATTKRCGTTSSPNSPAATSER